MKRTVQPRNPRVTIAVALVSCVAHVGLLTSLPLYFLVKTQSELIAVLEQGYQAEAALRRHCTARASGEDTKNTALEVRAVDADQRGEGDSYHDLAKQFRSNEGINVALWAIVWLVSVLLLLTEFAGASPGWGGSDSVRHHE